MVELNSNSVSALIYMLLVAAFCGALGGLAYEVLERLRQDGTSSRRKLWWFGGPFIGAVAAVAVLYVFPPLITIVQQKPDGTESTVYRYDMVKLIALSLITGSAGVSIIGNLQARVVAGIKETQVRTITETASQDLKQAGKAMEESSKDVGMFIENALPAIKEQLTKDESDVDEILTSIGAIIWQEFSLYRRILEREAAQTSARAELLPRLANADQAEKHVKDLTPEQERRFDKAFESGFERALRSLFENALEKRIIALAEDTAKEEGEAAAKRWSEASANPQDDQSEEQGLPILRKSESPESERNETSN
jgi:hypothetical protein